MALATTQEILEYLRSAAVSGQLVYTQIDRLRRGVEKAICRYVKWGIEAR